MLKDRLKSTRIARGHTQEELASRAHVGTRQIWRYENGETMPDADVLASIARVLEVSMDFLVGLSDDPMPDLHQEDLSEREKRAIVAWRQGDIKEAIKEIVNDGEPGPGA